MKTQGEIWFDKKIKDAILRLKIADKNGTKKNYDDIEYKLIGKKELTPDEIKILLKERAKIEKGVRWLFNLQKKAYR